MRKFLFVFGLIAMVGAGELAKADYTIAATSLVARCGGRSDDELAVFSNGTRIYQTTRYYGIESCREEAKEINARFGAARLAGVQMRMKNENHPKADIKFDNQDQKLVVPANRLSVFCGGGSDDNLVVTTQGGDVVYRSSRYYSISGCAQDARDVRMKINAALAVGQKIVFSLNDEGASDFDVSSEKMDSH